MDFASAASIALVSELIEQDQRSGEASVEGGSVGMWVQIVELEEKGGKALVHIGEH